MLHTLAGKRKESCLLKRLSWHKKSGKTHSFQGEGVCFCKSSSMFTNTLYPSKVFIHHLESNHTAALCPLLFSITQIEMLNIQAENKRHLVDLGYIRPLKHAVSN